jgi:hypothetical protein
MHAIAWTISLKAGATRVDMVFSGSFMFFTPRPIIRGRTGLSSGPRGEVSRPALPGQSVDGEIPPLFLHDHKAGAQIPVQKTARDRQV